MRRQTHASGGARALRYPVHFPAVVPQFAHVDKILAFLKANTVMMVAFAAAMVTMVIVPVDSAYLGYFDFKTLSCLCCVLRTEKHPVLLHPCPKDRAVFPQCPVECSGLGLYHLHRFHAHCK